METNETQGIDVPEVADNSAEPAKVHPAYEKLLNELPEAWHSKVTPYLQEQDRNFQQQLEKYTPFKQYVEQGVDPSVIDAGINLANAMDSNPMQVFTAMKDYLMSQGMLEAEAEQAAADAVEENYDDEEVPPALKKEIDALRQQTEQLSEFQQNQILEQQTNIELQNIQNEMADLKSKYNISDAHEQAIYNLMMAAENSGRSMSVSEAGQQLAQMIGGFSPVGAASASEPAPTVVSSAGGAGVPAQQLQIPQSDKGKKEMLAQLFAEYQRANNS
ncbi:MAG: hypothetical protein ACKOQ8_06195 [Micrococcales bacterium]